LGPEVQEGIDVSVVLEFLEVAEVFLSHRLGDAVLGPPPIENLGQALERLGNPAALLRRKATAQAFGQHRIGRRRA
jgi:hypothetical protein